MPDPENQVPEPGPESTPPAPPEPAAAEPAAAEPPAPPAPPAIADMPPAAVAAKLGELFPALFGAGRALPIKLRIQADIQQRAPGLFNKKSLSIFLHRHTTSTAYLKALAQAPARLDLDGQPAGDIAQEHRDAAAAELARRLAIVQERRAAERKAQREAERGAQRQAPREAQPEAQRAAMPAAPPDQRPARPPRGERPQRPPRPERPQRPQRPERPRPERAEQPPQAAPQAAPRAPLSPEQQADLEARRSRALVLRAFETTTLTRANFCALKGMSDAALEAVLVQARAERGDVAAPPPRGPRSR